MRKPNRPMTLEETENTIKDSALKNASQKIFVSDPSNFILILIKLGWTEFFFLIQAVPKY